MLQVGGAGVSEDGVLFLIVFIRCIFVGIGQPQSFLQFESSVIDQGAHRGLDYYKDHLLVDLWWWFWNLSGCLAMMDWCRPLLSTVQPVRWNNQLTLYWAVYCLMVIATDETSHLSMIVRLRVMRVLAFV